MKSHFLRVFPVCCADYKDFNITITVNYYQESTKDSLRLMGRKDVLDKSKKKHKKGLWSPDEDQKLRNYVLKHGHSCWSSVPVNAGIKRSGKSCRLRWVNYLRPGLKRGAFSIAEEDSILTLHQVLGNKWSQIAHHLPGRTDNEIKNYWHTYLKKRVPRMDGIEAHLTNDQIQTIESSPSSLESSAKNSSVFESFEQIERSAYHEIMQQNAGGNLPKILFSEWLSFDQFSGQDFGNNCGSVRDFKYNLNSNGSNLEDALVHGHLLVNEGTFGPETNTMICNMDDTLRSAFKFEYLDSENGFVNYFPGEFCMNYGDMYA